MGAKKVAPYGTWASPVTAELLTRAGIGLASPAFSGGRFSWLESRPAEAGRTVLVRAGPGGKEDVTPAGTSVRTAVHEYGGGECLVAGGTAWYSNWADQRIWRTVPGGAPVPVTPEPPRPRSLRYADARRSPDGRFLVCVRESHPEAGEAVNEIVTLPADGGEPVVVARGRDFYAAPRISPDGSRIAWLEWDHPAMPWDGTDLTVADRRPDGRAAGAVRVAGGPEESVLQPEWAADGTLHFLSDRTGFWNLYARRDGRDVPVHPVDADCADPPWNFGGSSYAFLADDRIVLKEIRNGVDRLLLLAPGADAPRRLAPEFVQFSGIHAAGRRVLAVAAAADGPPRVVVIDPDGETETLVRGLSVDLDPAGFSRAEPIAFPTSGGATARAFFYAPASADHEGPADERPPLVVLSHGGPTSAASPALSLGIQFFTSRGFAVVDVNYRGSTGFGRAYRNALRGRWGEVDVDDCVAAAESLVRAGRVDGARMAIRGGSAGGFTTLCALAFRDVFAAGVSRYGVADLEALARDTHKFESRYLDGLVGPYPERRDLYAARSPIHHVDGFSCPLLVLQGEEDPVVPPSQSLAIVAALRKKGVPVTYLSFPGEQHGFRRAENIRAALEAELAFLRGIFVTGRLYS